MHPLKSVIMWRMFHGNTVWVYSHKYTKALFNVRHIQRIFQRIKPFGDHLFINSFHATIQKLPHSWMNQCIRKLPGLPWVWGSWACRRAEGLPDCMGRVQWCFGRLSRTVRAAWTAGRQAGVLLISYCWWGSLPDYRHVLYSQMSTLKLRCLPNPSRIILISVESRMSLASFSIREIYVFVVPHFSANCSWVIPCSFLSSWSITPSLNASNPSSYFSRFSIPRFPYSESRWSANDVRFLFIFFIEVLFFKFFCKFYFAQWGFLGFLNKSVY